MPSIDYVLAIVLSLDQRRVLLLEKRSGPELLIGKLTGVGGKVEPGESHASAISRELAEEAGLSIPPEGFTFLARCSGDGWGMSVFLALSEIDSARSLTHEPVAPYPVSEILARVAEGSVGLSPDLGVFLTMALQRPRRPFEAQIRF